MRKLVYRICVVSALLPLTTGHAQLASVDRICAVVGEEIILESEVLDRVRLELLQQGRRPGMASSDEVQALSITVLKALVDDRMLLEVAKAESVIVTAQEVDDRLQEQLDQIKGRFATKDAFNEQLSREGTSERELRNQLRKQMFNYIMGERVVQSIGQATSVSFREVDQFLQAHKDSLPTVPASVTMSYLRLSAQAGEDERAAARQKLEGVRQRLVAGESFADLAREISQDPGSAPGGGDLGWFGRGLMVPQFEQAAFSLAPGQVSDVIETPFGMHMVKVEEVRGEEINARHILVRIEVGQAAKDAVRDTLESIRQRAREEGEFGILIKPYSDAENSEQGLRAQVMSENLPLPFVQALTSLPVGNVAQPFEGDPGTWYLVKLHERVPQHEMNMLDDRKQLEEAVSQMKLGEKVGQLLEKQRRETYIDVRCRYGDAG